MITTCRLSMYVGGGEESAVVVVQSIPVTKCQVQYGIADGTVGLREGRVVIEGVAVEDTLVFWVEHEYEVLLCAMRSPSQGAGWIYRIDI